MLPKALVIILLTATTTLGLGDTSIVDIDLQIVTRGQLQEIVNYLLDINGIRAAKVKLPLIKRFLGERLKLKGFLTQIYFKVIQEGAKLATPTN